MRLGALRNSCTIARTAVTSVLEGNEISKSFQANSFFSSLSSTLPKISFSVFPAKVLHRVRSSAASWYWVPAIQHLEVRRGGKHGYQFEKTSPPETLFAFLTHRQPDTIETNLFRCDEVFENCLAFTPLHLPKNRQASNAGLRILARKPAMLEAERENLLGK